MAVTRSRFLGGFTLIELMIAVAIIGVLAAIALGQYRDYTRRAKLTEVVFALGQCKTMVTEGYVSMQQGPDPGQWGCEAPAGSTAYVGPIQTSADGAIRVAIANLDPLVDGQFVYLVPLKGDGATPMTAAADLGNQVHDWMCGSDLPIVRNALPPNCRADTSAHAAATFE